jgi:hypothetical protein
MTLAILCSPRIASSSVKVSRCALSSSSCFWATSMSMTTNSENKLAAPCSQKEAGSVDCLQAEPPRDQIWPYPPNDAQPPRAQQRVAGHEGDDSIHCLLRRRGPTVVIRMELRHRTDRLVNGVRDVWLGGRAVRHPLLTTKEIARVRRNRVAAPAGLVYFCLWLMPCAISECSWAVFDWA